MQKLRLIGLVLFIVASFLGMAALATQTSHIRFRKDFSELPTAASPSSSSPRTPDLTSDTIEPLLSPEPSATPLAFVSVPVIWPIGGAGLLGLIIWFSLAPRITSATASRKRARRTTRKR